MDVIGVLVVYWSQQAELRKGREQRAEGKEQWAESRGHRAEGR
jgi:hypothetical protein